MASACALEPTGMSAVLGGDPGDVATALNQLKLDAANHNGAGQIVAAGRLDALAALAADKPDRTRVKPLPVAGAFHTHFMAPAEHALAQHAAQLVAKDPSRPLLSNADGALVADGAEMLQRLVAQITRAVRWDSCMATLRALDITATIELPPAGTLSGLVRRDLKGNVTLTLKAPEDLDTVAELIGDRFATAPSGIHA
jgi:[acyl-carrier-protein] S-malonyltransferase